MRIWSHSNERSQQKSGSLKSQRTNDGKEDKSSSLGKSQEVADEYFQFTTTVPGWNIQERERENLVAGSRRGCVRYAPTNNRKYP